MSRMGIFVSLLTILLSATFSGLLGVTPAHAQLPPGMKPFETTQVADGVYSFRFFFHNSIFIVTDRGVIATDPISPRAAGTMMAEIKKVTDQPVKFVVYSHEHWDHISGGQVFKDAGARFISQANCVPEFKKKPEPGSRLAGPNLSQADGSEARRPHPGTPLFWAQSW